MMIQLADIEQRVACEFPLFRDGQADLSKHLESYSFTEENSFVENGIVQRGEWFAAESVRMQKLMASIFPNRSADVHSAMSDLFMGPVGQQIRELDGRDRFYCSVKDHLEKHEQPGNPFQGA